MTLATLLSSGFQLFIPRYLGKAVDSAQGLLQGTAASVTEIEAALWLSAWMILVLSILRGLFAMVQNYFGESLNDCIAADLRKAFYHRVQQLDVSFHDNAHTGDLITRGMLDLEGIRHFPSTGLVRTVMLLVLVVGGSILLISTDTVLGLISLSFVPVIAVTSAIARIQLRYLWLKQQERLTVLTNAMEENLTGIRIVRAFAAQAHELLRFDKHSVAVRQVAFERLMARVRSMTFMGFSFFVALTLALWVGGNKVLAGEITVGTLTEFLAFMMILQMPVRQIGMTVNSYARASTCGARFFEILDYPNPIESGKTLPDLKITKGEVRFEGVHFGYGEGETRVNVLSDITFSVTAGKTVGGVQQDSFVFTASVDSNIAYGNPWSDEAGVIQAGRDAQLHDFISDLPGNYQTLVGERGVSLSGGQRQRVSIARGNLVNAPICILDDATAAIDADTERRIHDAVTARHDNRTSIVISHRLVSIMHADEILFLEEGKIVERGTHEGLLDLGGRYAELHSLQMGAANSVEPILAQVSPG